MKYRILIDTLDHTGHIIKVPLSDDTNPQYAVVDKDTFNYLLDQEITLVWYIHERTGRVIAWDGYHYRFIDRIIADAGPKQSVYSLDGNPLNLKRWNLALTKNNRAEYAARSENYLPKHNRISHVIHFWCTYAH